jgi:hypothetical protein
MLVPTVVVTLALVLSAPAAQAPRTRVSIVDGRWHLNGQVTYRGAVAEGLLMNVRMVNAVFEDANDTTRQPGFDSDVNTEAFISSIPQYVAQGVRAFTISLQGGDPGYEGALNSAFTAEGALRDSYLARVRAVVEAVDRHGAVVILSCFYQRQDQALTSDEAVRTAVGNVARWIADSGFTNVVLEIANEFGHKGFDHQLLRGAEGQAELIRRAKQVAPRLLVSSSGLGDGRIPNAVAAEADFMLPHFNNTPVSEIAARAAALKANGKPILCNEDDKIAELGAKAAEEAVAHGVSWGFMTKTVNQHHPFRFSGAEDDPIVYATLRRLTTSASTR